MLFQDGKAAIPTAMRPHRPFGKLQRMLGMPHFTRSIAHLGTIRG